MSEMVERVARAMFKASEPVSNWDDMGERYHAQWRTEARAAIEAMREPTEEMIGAGQETNNLDEDAGHFEFLSRDEMADAWQAMVDKAISG